MCVNFNIEDIIGVAFKNLQSLNISSGKIKNCLFYDDKIITEEFNFNQSNLADTFFINISRNFKIQQDQ